MRSRDTVVPRTIPVQMARELTDDQLRWWRALGWLPPMVGADDEGESADSEGGGEGEAGGEAGGAGATGESGGAAEEEEEESSGGSEEEEEESDGHPKDVMELSRSEYERLRRIAREKDAADKRAERERKRSQEKQRREQGEYEELLRDKDEEIQKAEAERDEARYQLDAYKRRIRVSEAAKRLGFKDPEDAFRFLSDEDTEDDTSTERALKRLARSKAYLVHERRSSGAPVNGDGVTLTLDQIQNMSKDEINERWDEVQKAMAAG